MNSILNWFNIIKFCTFRWTDAVNMGPMARQVNISLCSSRYIAQWTNTQQKATLLRQAALIPITRTTISLSSKVTTYRVVAMKLRNEIAKANLRKATRPVSVREVPELWSHILVEVQWLESPHRSSTQPPSPYEIARGTSAWPMIAMRLSRRKTLQQSSRSNINLRKIMRSRANNPKLTLS